MEPKGKSLACPLLVTLLRQRRRCSFKCFTLVIHSLFFPLLSVESLSPFPILFSHSVFAVCCNGPLGKFWRLHTKDNKNNWSKSQQMKLNRQRWMVFMRAGVCVFYIKYILTLSRCQWHAAYYFSRHLVHHIMLEEVEKGLGSLFFFFFLSLKIFSCTILDSPSSSVKLRAANLTISLENPRKKIKMFYEGKVKENSFWL